MASSLPALRGYRRLLRASRALFGKDLEGLLTSRAFIRRQFDENRGESDPDVIGECLVVNQVESASAPPS